MKSHLIAALAGCATLGACASGGGPQINSQTTRTETCEQISEEKIGSLFDRWNQFLQTGDPQKVVANYAERSILLPPSPTSLASPRRRRKTTFRIFWRIALPERLICAPSRLAATPPLMPGYTLLRSPRQGQ